MLLIVRTQDKLLETIDFFEKSGHSALGLPISTTIPQPIDIPEEIQGLILTSSSAIDALPAECSLPVHCVGAATADRLAAKGGNVGLHGVENGRSLAEKILQTLPPQPLLHAAGDQAGTDWYDILEKAGFTITTKIAYKTQYLEALPNHIKTPLLEKKIKAVLVFSAKGAQHFTELAKTSGMQKNTLQGIVFSAHIAEKLEDTSLFSTLSWPEELSLTEMGRCLHHLEKID